MKTIGSFIVLFTSVCLCACATRPPLATVRSVDLDRYSGRWHEIAKYPNWFQRACAEGAIADYSALPDGSIK
ncbi:MAG: lipocalin family protein, partial [Terrimicrobiaceae bacterium]